MWLKNEKKKNLLADNFITRFQGVHHTRDARIRKNIRRNFFINMVGGEKANATTCE